MKNTFYYLAILLGLALTSCEPMEDIHDEINSTLDNEKAVGDIVYTLTEDDYEEELDLDHTNFNSVDQAKELLPDFLADQFPYYGPESSALITFDIWAPKSKESSLIVYEATKDDAFEYGSRFGNFDRLSQVEDLLNAKFGDEPNRTLVSLTYEWYTSTTGKVERNDGFLLLDGEWTFVTGITRDEYAALGENYSDFSTKDEALTKIPVFLKDKYSYENPNEGDIKAVMYKLYQKDYDDVDRDGISVDDPNTEEEEPTERLDYGFVVYFIYDGSTWVEYKNTIDQTVKFGNINGTWIPDNTIRHTFTGADYAVVKNAFIDVYPGPADNVGFFKSFDVRSSSSNYWSPEMLLKAMNVVLDNLAPNAEEGQKYVVTFAIYNGAPGTETLSLIKVEGEWVLNN